MRGQNPDSYTGQVKTKGSARPAACFNGLPARVEGSLSVLWGWVGK